MTRIVCPIGATAGLAGKEPGVIAVAVAAELLARREARARAAATRTGAQIAPLHADGIAAGAVATREQRA
jgi:xanthine/CO dehydrogenase XdhC/CoxF family maturation factor